MQRLGPVRAETGGVVNGCRCSVFEVCQGRSHETTATGASGRTQHHVIQITPCEVTRVEEEEEEGVNITCKQTGTPV